MAMVLDKVVPFGRSLDEYRHMFALSEADLEKSIIGAGDGPASFNAEMYAMGRRVISVDPIYAYAADEIQRRFYVLVDDIIEQVRATPDDWSWSYHKSPEKLRRLRESVMLRFAGDFQHGLSQQRYCIGELPRFDFPDQSFQLALCSHLLFLYSAQLDYGFHLASIHEMLRLASEVRIFPLLSLSLQPSPYLERIVDELTADGISADIVKVDYEMQRGGNEMLVLRCSR